MNTTYDRKYNWFRVYLHGKYNTKRVIGIRLWPFGTMLTWCPEHNQGHLIQEAKPLRLRSFWRWLTLS